MGERAPRFPPGSLRGVCGALEAKLHKDHNNIKAVRTPLLDGWVGNNNKINKNKIN